MKYKQLDSGVMVPCGPKDVAFDGLVNIASGLGTSKSKRSQGRWQRDFTGYDQLDAIYQSNWIARAIIDEWARAMTREWRDIKSAHAEDIASEEQRLCLKQTTEEAICWARLYGGCGVVMVTNQNLEEPLNLDKIKKGSLEKLEVFDRYDLTPYGEINSYDMLASNYLRPDFFILSGGSQKIHHSHIAFFNGARLPKRDARMNYGWGDSELRRCMEEINDVVASKGGIAELMSEANIDVITREGLNNELSTDQDDSIIKRYELFSMMKSIVNMALLDGEEKLDRQTLNLSGVSQVLEVLMVWIAGAARMPMTEIFGTSAQGLSATGEGDRKGYHSKISAQQHSDLSRSIRQIDEVLVRSAVGSWPDDYDYIWNPLEQLDGVQVAQERLLAMQKHQLALQSNLVQRSQVMRVLQSNEEYQYDDDEIDQLEVNEEGNLFEEIDIEPVEEEKVSSNDGWITSNGAKILLNSNGEIEAGMGAENKGKTMSEATSKEEPKQMTKTEALHAKLAEAKKQRVAAEKKLSAQLKKTESVKSELASVQAEAKEMKNLKAKAAKLEAKIEKTNAETKKIDLANTRSERKE